jgi:hypothetical protein
MECVGQSGKDPAGHYQEADISRGLKTTVCSGSGRSALGTLKSGKRAEFPMLLLWVYKWLTTPAGLNQKLGWL